MLVLPQIDPAAVAATASLTLLVVQVILTAAAPTDAASARWGPLLAVAVGLAIAEAGAIASGPVDAQLVAAAAWTGIAGGLSAMGFHSIATKSALGSLVSGALGVAAGPAQQAQAPDDPAPAPAQ